MRKLFVCSAILFSILGCSRQPNSHSNVSFIAGNASNGTFAAIPGGRVVCYGVSVKGSGIPSTPASTCKPEVGTTIGFAANGATLSGQVLKGQNRTFDVYLYLQATGENLPCPTMAGGFQNIPATKLYHVGTVANVNIEKDTETINIPTTFPGEALNLVNVNSYPGSCVPAAPTVASSYQISSSVDNATGAGYILQGRVGRTNSGTILTGTGFQLRVKD